MINLSPLIKSIIDSNNNKLQRVSIIYDMVITTQKDEKTSSSRSQEKIKISQQNTCTPRKRDIWRLSKSH